MKAFLLTVTALMVYAGSVFAQNLPPDYSWEVGVNAGQSAITRPLGPAEAYSGKRTNLVLDYSVRLNYFLTPNWMLNLDIGNRKWETFGNWVENGKFGTALKSEPVSFLIADNAITEMVGINYVIPFYTEYNTFNRSNINFGVALGLVTTTNDGSLSYSTYKSAPDPSFTYTSRYDYGYGIGYTFGVQAGYTYYIIPRLAINVDLAVRYADVRTNDIHYDHENSRYYLLYFPETLGIRWRF
jgi:hypothetical protein